MNEDTPIKEQAAFICHEISADGVKTYYYGDIKHIVFPDGKEAFLPRYPKTIIMNSTY